MSTLQQLQAGFSHAWETLVDGWRHLYHRAASAMTRFVPHQGTAGEGDGAMHELDRRSSGWGVLAAEVFDDEDKVVVRLEVPGMEAGEFRLEVIDRALVVRGEKRLQRERTQGRYHVSECAYGRFERAIALPDEVDPDQAEASYKRGILRVELPRRRSSERRRIQVRVH